MLLALLYLWAHASAGDTLAARFPPPAGFTRVAVADGSFGDWLRHLPMRPPGTSVHLWDGRLKPRQDVHAGVVDLDVPKRDLQQCADAVMRLWAEYRYAAGLPAVFHPDPGKRTELRWSPKPGDRQGFERWLIRVFADAGSASLQAELRHADNLEPGDVLIQGGYPGHAVLVLDAVSDGKRTLLLLGQSYMPAQDFHVLRNPAATSLAPWFDAATLDGTGMQTPEWLPFHRKDVRRFQP